jgi:thioredoxin reductase (NADPH)
MENFFDVIIIGGGPAGLTAALYLARARYRALVVEKERFGGQITITSEVVNYPGVARGSGEDITAVMRSQAQSFGAEFLLAEVTAVELTGQEKIVHTNRGEYRAFGLILAAGAHPRQIGFDGEEEFKGRGVAYCATCDGEFFTGLEVFVVGGGFAAAEEAVFLTKYARHVTVLVRGEDFTCAQAVSDQVKAHEKITVRYNAEVVSVSGDQGLDLIRCRDHLTGQTWEYQATKGETFGVFVFAGYEPATALVRDQINLDEQGYVLTDPNCRANLEGVYAAGDIRQKVLRQMVTATADGAIAATELERYVAAKHRQTGKIPQQPTSRIHQKKPPAQPETSDEGFFSADVKEQLDGVFQKMESPIVLRLELDDRPVSLELKAFVNELAGLTDRISVEYLENFPEGSAPCARIFRSNGIDTGAAFHGVPGGHEFNSFILGLYNAAGPGQTLDSQTLEKIRAIDKPLNMKILVSLTCTMCPDLVLAAQRLAMENPLIRAEVYDLNHFPELRDRYKVMSVPCLLLNDETISFGKKNITQLLEFLTDPRSDK